MWCLILNFKVTSIFSDNWFCLDVLQQIKYMTPDLKQVKHLDITVEIRIFNSEEEIENSFMRQVFGHF